MKITAYLTLLAVFGACTATKEEKQQNLATQVIIETTMGNITLELSSKTPLHRENFVKLVNDGMYDSILFHRVLQDFVIQAGEIDSLRLLSMDSLVLESLDYRIPAEFDSTLFHKRGALGAARDGNPQRASSSIQFYIVQAGPQPDSMIIKGEKRINDWLRRHYSVHASQNKYWLDSLNFAYESGDYELIGAINDTISKIAQGFEDFQPYIIPQHQKVVYQTKGGTPHLDQNYTVFGEVIKGMEVVDSIAAVPVGENGRPIKPVMILKARILN